MTWDSLLKWKPPKDNTTISMLYLGSKNTIEDNKSFRYRELILHVFTIGPNGHYEKIQFSPPRFNTDNPYIACVEMKTNDHIYCVNGDVISNNSIVEFAFDNNKKGGFRWIPRNNRR